MNGYRGLYFIKSHKGNMTRGWDPESVLEELHNNVSCEVVEINSAKDILDIPEINNSLVWPLFYTLQEEQSDTCLVSFLEMNDINFIGPKKKSVPYTSKILLKELISSFEVLKTPEYMQVSSVENIIDIDLEYPLMIKNEFSTDSIGVELISSAYEIPDKFELVKSSFPGRVFLEKWERKKEYTVSVIPQANLYSCVEMIIEGSSYASKHVKKNNKLVKLNKITKEKEKELLKLTKIATEVTGISSHFRLDFVENNLGQLFIIDLNLMPHMKKDSYFISSFKETHGLNFRDTINKIISA